MSLSTGKQIHSYHWKILPATDAVIKQVHDMATQEEQPELVNNELLFEWEAGIPIEYNDLEIDNEAHNELDNREDFLDRNDDINMITDDKKDVINNKSSDDSIFIPEETNDNSEDDDLSSGTYDNSENASLNIDDSDISYDVDPDVVSTSTHDNSTSTSSGAVPPLFPTDTPKDTPKNIDIHEDEGATFENKGASTINEVVVEDVDEKEDDANENIDQTRTDRPRRSNAGQGVDRLEMHFGGKSYQHFPQKQMTMVGNKMNRQERKRHLSFLQKQAKKLDKRNNSQYLQSAMNVMFTQIEDEFAQIPAHEGIKKYGEQAVAAMIKEFEQLDNGAIPGKRVVSPIDVSTLTDEDKQKALDAVLL